LELSSHPRLDLRGWNAYRKAGPHASTSTTYAASLQSFLNASRNRSWATSPTPQSNRTSGGANKPFSTALRHTVNRTVTEYYEAFFSILKTITSADGSFANKVGALASCFETGEILLPEAHGYLATICDETSRQPIWNSPAFQITNPVLMNENVHGAIIPNPTKAESFEQLSSCVFLRIYLITNQVLMNENGHGVIIPNPTKAESIEQLSSCVFLGFDLTIAPTTAYGECLESRFALKARVAIPDIVRNNAFAPPIRKVRKLFKVKDLLVANQGYTGASLIVETIKPPQAGVHEYYLQCVFDKHDAFWAIKPPHTFADLRMLIRTVGFYSRWLPNYGIRIQHCRWIIKQQPALGSATPALEREFMAKLRDLPDLTLLDKLKEEIINGLVLARPDYKRRFYLNTGWSKHGMAAVL
jgi:hypothetical protein